MSEAKNGINKPIPQPVAIPPATGNIDPSSLIFTEDFAFVDTETTGMDAAVDKIVEIAIYRVRNGVPEVFHTLVNPAMPIPPTASAVHHITDEMVADKPRFEDIAEQVIHALDGAYVIAHNAPFDSPFVDGELGVEPDPKSWICSVRLAKHLMPNAPAYGNQVLRYWLKTNPKSEGLGAHRAIDDVHVSVENVRHMLKIAQEKGLKNFGQVLDLSNEPIIAPFMPFGEHVGKEFKDIPSSYLKWALGLIPGKKGLDLDADMRVTMERQLEIPNRSVDVVVPDMVMNFGKPHNGKKMADVPTEYLEWIERENPRTCPPGVRVGVDKELSRRRAELGASPAPKALDLQIAGLTEKAQFAFNRLAAMVSPGSDDEQSLIGISFSDNAGADFERYLKDFGKARPAEYARVAALVGGEGCSYMIDVAQLNSASSNRSPSRAPAPAPVQKDPSRLNLLNRTPQGEPDQDGLDGPPPMEESAPFEAASGTRRPRMR
ncbi:3'-5' exonuclease [Paucibacter soli]|uniref:3'-5' exonuclease n=1 Tax=Paucibacter soli TaxID=3133433 RepID=UPI0030AFBA39